MAERISIFDEKKALAKVEIKNLRLTITNKGVDGQAYTKWCSRTRQGKYEKGWGNFKFEFTEPFSSKPDWLGLISSRIKIVKAKRSGLYNVDPEALYGMGLLCNGEDDEDGKAQEYFKRAAALGHKGAMSSLALAQLGRPDADSKKKGLEAMTKLAEEGVGDAQAWLGMAYEYGLAGLARNDAKAIEWNTRASSNGNAIAMCILGDRYAVGRGVAKDEERAFALFKKAAPNSSVGAYHLGVAYERGIGCEKNERRAFAAYDRAAKEGHLAAQYEVAERYGQGNGVEADDAKAEHWWKQAAENGKVKSFGDLEWIFRHGNECDIAEGRARALYRNAAARGDTDAMLRHGMSYYDLSKNAWTDRTLGRSWIEKAAKRGHRFASKLLKQMDEGSGANKGSGAN